MDFTLKKYSELLGALKDKGYRLITFENYCSNKIALSDESFAILRHDVDLKAKNALAVARIEHAFGIHASYYFRVVKQSNRPDIIRAIMDLGHEIGYHYEDMTICNGDVDKAAKHFESQLAYFRQYYPVTTICMHGSPLSRYDGRDLWRHLDYHDYGIIGEPYFDVDFSKVFYLTDTGRKWDGFHVSVRDKIPEYQEEWVKRGLVFHATDEIIDAIGDGRLPLQLMFTTHPQRWTDNPMEWLSDGLKQDVKNVVKWLLLRKKEKQLSFTHSVLENNCTFAPKL